MLKFQGKTKSDDKAYEQCAGQGLLWVAGVFKTTNDLPP